MARTCHLKFASPVTDASSNDGMGTTYKTVQQASVLVHTSPRDLCACERATSLSLSLVERRVSLVRRADCTLCMSVVAHSLSLSSTPRIVYTRSRSSLITGCCRHPRRQRSSWRWTCSAAGRSWAASTGGYAPRAFATAAATLARRRYRSTTPQRRLLTRRLNRTKAPGLAPGPPTALGPGWAEPEPLSAV